MSTSRNFICPETETACVEPACTRTRCIAQTALQVQQRKANALADHAKTDRLPDKPVRERPAVHVPRQPVTRVGDQPVFVARPQVELRKKKRDGA